MLRPSMVPSARDVDDQLGEVFRTMSPPQPQPSISAVAVRAIDEMVEVGLAAGLAPNDILGVV